MRVLITGSHGFVGTNLIETLTPIYNIIRWNARKDRSLPECDAVIHLTGLAHDTKNVIGPERYFDVNTEITKKIFNRFMESSAKKFIFFSSVKAQENDTPYAKSKKQAEEYILNKFQNSSSWTNQAAEPSVMFQDKQVYILRPCMIHGKGNKGNLNLLVKWVKKGWPWPLAAFANKRSYASMGNVSYIIEQLLSKNVESGIYEVCDDEPISTNELIEIISRCMGKEIKMICVPRNIMEVIARVGGWLHLPLNTERLRKLTENKIVDNSKIKMALGIDKMPIGAKDGLRMSIQSMQK